METSSGVLKIFGIRLLKDFFEFELLVLNFKHSVEDMNNEERKASANTSTFLSSFIKTGKDVFQKFLNVRKRSEGFAVTWNRALYLFYSCWIYDCTRIVFKCSNLLNDIFGIVVKNRKFFTPGVITGPRNSMFVTGSLTYFDGILYVPDKYLRDCGCERERRTELSLFIPICWVVVPVSNLSVAHQ